MINHFTSFHEFLQSFWMACFLRIRLNNLIIYCTTLFPRIRRTIYYTRYHKILHNPFYSNSYDIILHPLQQNTAHPFLLEFVWQYTTTKYVSNFNAITHFLILPSITSAITTSYSLPCQRVPNSVLSLTIVHFITTSSHFNLHNLLPNNLVFHSLRSKL